jgi:hypothetical protein
MIPFIPKSVNLFFTGIFTAIAQEIEGVVRYHAPSYRKYAAPRHSRLLSPV